MKARLLSIHQDSSIRDVQDIFTEWYPYLRINFFLKRDKEDAGRKQTIVFIDSVKLKEINPAFEGGTMEVDDHMAIGDFEKRFYSQFGLYVEVTRKSGNLWLNTSKTNQWTLREQNEHGQAISPEHTPPNFGQVPYGC